MAEVDCTEVCLPSEFLAEDMFLGKKSGKSDGEGGGEECFPSEFPYDWVYLSEVSSKVEPVTGVEGRDEECVAGLSRQMTHYFLHEDEKAAPAACSPLSTLSAAANWNSSSREPSLLASTPPTHLGKHKGDAEVQLYAAAEKQRKQSGRGLLCAPAGKSFSPFTAGLAKNATTGYYAYPALGQHKDAIAQIQQLKRQQLAELQLAAAWRRHNRAKWGGGIAGSRPVRSPGSPKASWAPHPPQTGSGMRAVFLGPAAGRESCGTGVFLPRRIGSPAEPRKKPALSTVLLPARVMQALNLNLDDFGAQPRSPGGSLLQQDAIIARHSAMTSQRRNYRPQPVHAGHHHHEVCLPAEWTY